MSLASEPMVGVADCKSDTTGSIPADASNCLPNTEDVAPEDRIRIAGWVASQVPYQGVPTIEEQGRRAQDPRMFLYHILLRERADHAATQRKLAETVRKLIEVSKELSALKKNRNN